MAKRAKVSKKNEWNSSFTKPRKFNKEDEFEVITSEESSILTCTYNSKKEIFSDVNSNLEIHRLDVFKWRKK